jgi:hypothetical protein
MQTAHVNGIGDAQIRHHLQTPAYAQLSQGVVLVSRAVLRDE